MEKIKIRKKCKKGVSLMVSYVLLIVIAITIAILVYVWMKKSVIFQPTPKCPKGTSLRIQDYKCNKDAKTIEITVKNNGLFNISGYDIRGINDKTKDAVFPLKDVGLDILIVDGRYYFESPRAKPLAPGEENVYKFSYGVGIMEGGTENLEKIELQAFKDEGETVVICSKITQEIDCESASICGNNLREGTEECDNGTDNSDNSQEACGEAYGSSGYTYCTESCNLENCA